MKKRFEKYFIFKASGAPYFVFKFLFVYLADDKISSTILSLRRRSVDVSSSLAIETKVGG